MDIKISVVMPVYNAEKYLDEAINSVLKQTLKDIELICINDGSTDNSWNVIQNYASKDSRIKAYSQENKGRSAARNKALDIAQGEFVSFLDSDDFYPNEKSLEILYNTAKINNVEVCRGYITSKSNNGDVAKIVKQISQTEWIDFIKEGFHFTNKEACLFGWTAYIYKREFLNRCQIRLSERDFFEDPLFLTDVLCNIDKFSHVNIDSYCIRGGTHSYSYSIKIVEQLIGAVYLIMNKANNLKKWAVMENCLFSIMNAQYYSWICRSVLEENFNVLNYLSNINNLLSKTKISYSDIFKSNVITKIINDAQSYKDEIGINIKKYDNVLLYGAGINGRKLKNLLKRDFDFIPTGFAVTEQKEETEYVDGLLCKKISSWQFPSNNTLIIISVAEKMRKEIEAVLKDLKYNYIYFDRTRWLICNEDDMTVYSENRPLNGRDT